MTNVFEIIRNQVLANEIDRLKENPEREGKSSFTVKGYYPEKAIVWLTTVKKLFKIAKVDKSYDLIHNKYVYEVFYKDFNEYSDYVQGAIESFKNKKDKYEEYYKTQNMSVIDKAMYYNDTHRFELECPNWSNQKDETGYAQCPNNDREYEHLSREDSVRFEMFCQFLGYDNYEDFIENNKLDNEEIDMLYTQFTEGSIAPEYAF